MIGQNSIIGSNVIVKLFINLDTADWHGHGVESIWATPIHDKLVCVENSPFFAKGISYLDEVNVVERDGQLWFEKVAKKSGHSTYRIILSRQVTSEQLVHHWEALKELGCTYESLQGDYVMYSVDVPPDADIRAVYAALEKGEREGIWGFEEGDYKGIKLP